MTPDKYSTRSNSKRTGGDTSQEELPSIPESSGEDYTSDATMIEDSSEDTKQIKLIDYECSKY
jgi:hypothetical protein